MDHFNTSLMKTYQYILSIIVLGFVCLPVFSQPVNDDLCNAFPLTVNAPCNSAIWSNTNATQQAGEPTPSCFVGQNKSVWFSFIAPLSGVVTISTDTDVTGTNTDTEIALYSLQGGDCSQPSKLFELACHQDISLSNPPNYLSEIPNAPVNPGQTYYIQVSGWNTVSGTFCLEITAPSNDNLCNAIGLTVGASCISPNGDNTGATQQAGEPDPACFSGQNPSIWYFFEAPPSGNVTITTNNGITGTNTDTEIALYSLSGGNCNNINNLSEIACSQDLSNNFLSTISVNSLTPGERYFIQVSGWNNRQGSFCLEVYSPPVNDDLCDHIPLTVGLNCTSLNGDNTHATLQSFEPRPSCFVGTVNSVWYSFVGPPAGVVSISTNSGLWGTNNDTEIALYTLPLGSCNTLWNLELLACNQDINEGAGIWRSEILDAIVVPEQTYYIQVSGYAGREGSFCIEIDVPDPPVNDELCDAIPLQIGEGCTSPNGNNKGATFEPGEWEPFCFEEGVNSIWYSFVGPSDGNITITTNTAINGTHPNTEIALYSLTGGDCSLPSNLQLIECNQDISEINKRSTIRDISVNPGQTYYIQVSGSGGSFGTFCIEVQEAVPIAPPPNDDLCSATPLVVGTTCTDANGDNTFAGRQINEPEPFCFVGGVNSVWYKILAPSSGAISISTNTAFVGTNQNTEIALFSLPEGSCNDLENLQLLGCSQDLGGTNLQASMNNIEVSPGQTYYIQVSGHSGAEGTFCIEVEESSPLSPPSNDDICNAEPIMVGASCSQTWTNIGASFEQGEPSLDCFQGIVRSVWFTFVAPPSGLVNITTDAGVSGSLQNTEISIFRLVSGDCSNFEQLERLACNNDIDTSNLLSEILMPVNPDEIYYIQVSGENNLQGTFCLEVKAENPKIIYVDKQANGQNTGKTWADAYKDLQVAIDSAERFNQIFVAKGTYYPISPQHVDRDSSFILPDDVRLYGGFAGTEASLADRAIDSMSLHVMNRTLLSGDIGNPGDSTDNSIHVVWNEGNGFLNGFTIAGGNSPNNGGGIYCLRSSLTLRNCILTKNRSLTFGGGLYSLSSKLQIDNCSFVRNNSQFHGGAIYNNSVSDQSWIRNCQFSNNAASSNGGAIRNFTGGIPIHNSIFHSNEARFGGAIANSRYIKPNEIIGCRFTENKAIRNATSGGGEGGALHCSESTVIMDSCTFLNNEAGMIGGAAKIQRNAIISHSLFRDNTAEFAGGGIHSGRGAPRILSSVFTENQADSLGGAIFNNGGIMILQSNTYSQNQTSGAGGGIYSAGGRISLFKSELDQNKADVIGGGIYANSTFLTIDSTSFLRNEAMNGGGLYITVGSLQLNNSTFKQNRSISSISTAGLGGGIFSTGSFVEMDHITFLENEASFSGGAIHQSGDPLIRNCSFIRNQTLQRVNSVFSGGGSIYSEFGSSPSVIACNFIDNTSKNAAGAIFLNGGSPLIEKTSFVNNSALFGGAIHADDAELNLINSTLSSNRATSIGNGGGLRVRSGTALINGCTFYKNVSNRGSSISIDDNGNTRGIVSLKNSIISTNASAPENIRIINGELKSLGYNLIGFVRPTLGFLGLATDQIGSKTSPIDPLLDSLRMNGGPTPTHAPLANSPLIGMGEKRIETDLATDQRGYSRLIGSRDSVIDIGAYQSQFAFIQSAEKQFCMGNSAYIKIPEIVISDSTGGAMVEGVHLQLELSLPEDMSFQENQGEIICSGNGLQDCAITVEETKLILGYTKLYDTSLNTIRIQGLSIRSDSTQSPGQYPLLLTGGTAINGNRPEDSVVHASFQVLPIFNLVDLPYDESFETGDTLWTSAGNNNSWEWGIPSGTVIDTASDGRFAWTTGLITPYQAEENGYVISPCFDFKGLQQPMLSLDYWSDTETGFDGAVLQSSIDAGQTWQTVGTDESGVNWYNTAFLFANPGDQESASKFGWTGPTDSWQRASHRLDHLIDASAVRFRVAFGSIGTVDTTQKLNGFAFDNIFIGERNRKILLEHFTDKSREGDQQTFQTLVRANERDVVPIQLHMSDGDSFYEKNPAGPRARALYYGISEAGMTIAGGNGFLGFTSSLSQQDLDQIILREPVFEISIDSTQSEGIRLTANRSFEEEIVVYVAVIEHTKEERDVFRTFLPDAAGLSFFSWSQGESKSIAPTWDASHSPPPSIADHYDSLHVVVFVQNQESKEIYQAASSPVWPTLLNPNDMREQHLTEQSIEGLTVYPNPAHEQIWIEFAQVIEERHTISLVDMRGKILNQQVLPAGRAKHSIQVADLASGMYYLTIQSADQPIRQQKIMVVH